MKLQGYGKKALSLAVAAAMAASLCVPVWAEETLTQPQTAETAATAETAQRDEAAETVDGALLANALTAEPSTARANGTTVEVGSDEEWQAAVANAASGVETTLLVTQDITVSQSVTVKADQILVVDFQGHNITVTPDFTGRIFTNNGTLTLQGNGTVDVSAADTTGYGTVNNFGTLTVVDGTYSNLNENANTSNFYNRDGATATFENPTILSACGSVATANTAKTTIYGGKYTSKTYPAIENRGDMLITAGTFVNTSCSGCTGKWGYTIRSGENSDVAYLKIQGAAEDSVQVTGVQGGLAVIGGTADIYNGVYKTEACPIHGSSGAFYAGYFTGESYKTSTNIYGGTFQSCSKTGILVGNGNPAPDSGAGKDSTVMIFGGNFAGGDTAQTAITVNEDQYAVGAAKIYGGYFSSKPSDEFLAEGLTYLGSDQAGYLYMVGKAGESPATVVQPADAQTGNQVPDTAAPADKELAEAVETKLDSLTVEQSVLVAQAQTAANENAVTAAQGAAALAEAGVTVSAEQSVTIVVQPYLDIQVVDAAAADSDTAKKSFTLDVTPMYRTLATTAADPYNDTLVVAGEEEGGETANAVVMGEAKKLEITRPVEMTVQLPADFTTETTLFVFHQKDDGRSFCYEGTVSGDLLTFTNPNGFSKLTITTDTRKAVLDVDGTEITLTGNMVDQVIPVPDKSGYTFKGITVENVDGYTETYRTLTYDLLTALSAAYSKSGQPITAHAVFAKNPTTQSSGSGSGSSSTTTTTTNNNTTTTTQSGPTIEYYTCPACGYHNWTAAATGYKCDHCGYVESTKQLSSYGNVKGSYDPQSAITQASATVAQGSIPQTSDDMPLVGLAVVAIVALLGLGVTVVMKKRNTH